MKKAVWSGILTGIGVLVMSTSAFAQATDGKTVNVNANVNSKAKLDITGSVTFSDTGNPDDTPVLSAGALTIGVKARTTANGGVTLTVKSDGDLKAGATGPSIAISNLTWDASGTGFVANSTGASTTEQNVAAFTGSGTHSGTQTYKLANKWDYATAAYTAVLTYTLTAP